MVNQITRCGLIVTHAARTTALLDEFITLCDWPVLADPSIRALFEQIGHSHPSCLVFWLEGEADHSQAAALVTRLRDRGPRPYRIAIAEGLPETVEHTFRSAGVHTYLTASDDIAAVVEAALLPFLDPQQARPQQATPQQHPAHIKEPHVAIRGPTDPRASPATFMRPP